MSDEDLENVDPFVIMTDIQKTTDRAFIEALQANKNSKDALKAVESLKADVKTGLETVLSSFKAEEKKLADKLTRNRLYLLCGATIALFCLFYLPQLHCLLGVNGHWYETAEFKLNDKAYTLPACIYFEAGNN